MTDTIRAGANLSVIITALNEAIHIGRCVKSVVWAAEVFVVDGGSTDETMRIARDSGAEVVAHGWMGYAAQKNWALENLPLHNDWVLFLDADEVVPPELAQEIMTVVQNSHAGRGVYFVNRRMIFLGKWLRRVWWYPDRTVRLVRRSAGGAFEDRSVHERWVGPGAVGYLNADLIHENLKPVHEYVERLNRYSTLEALEALRWRWVGKSGDIAPSFAGNWAERRRALKLRVWYRLPFRPYIRLLWMWFVRLGFLDGTEGWIFTKLHVYYETLIDIKLKELQRRRGNREYLEYVETRLPGARAVAASLADAWGRSGQVPTVPPT
jgi:glycosyltransferase involved in cell wall biosynthesis